MILKYLLFIILIKTCLSKKIIKNSNTKFLHFWDNYNCSGNDIIFNNITLNNCYNIENKLNQTVLSLESSDVSWICLYEDQNCITPMLNDTNNIIFNIYSDICFNNLTEIKFKKYVYSYKIKNKNSKC